MSESEKYFRYLVEEIHTTIMATVDEGGLPVTAAIDIMDTDGESLFFLTAKGKSLYDRLVSRPFVSLTALKGEDTMSSKALTVRGRVRELGYELIPELFEKNPYMKNIYPTEESMRALTAFQIFMGSGEWFDLSKRPIERASFEFGTDEDAETDDMYFLLSVVLSSLRGCAESLSRVIYLVAACCHHLGCDALFIIHIGCIEFIVNVRKINPSGPS